MSDHIPVTDLWPGDGRPNDQLPHERRGPWVFAAGTKPEIRTCLGVLEGEVKRVGSQYCISEGELQIGVRQDVFGGIVLRMIRDVVYFEHPEEETTSREVAATMSYKVPKTWQDGWKRAHPRLTRLLRLRAPEFEDVTIEWAVYHVHKHYHLEGVIRR